MSRLLDRAREIAEEVLFPASLAVDAAPRVPATQLDLLAAEGFYGMAGPAGPDFTTACRIVEELASGCLTTTFVFQQHHGTVRAVATSSTPGLAGAWLEPLCRGQSRAGTVQAALRPGPPSVRARGVDGGYLFDGAAPWVSGWGMVDVLHTAGRDEQDTLHWALLDARPGPTLSVDPVRLVAANAS
ncbi:MAG: acyl-CoA dehydrogenase family protein, partial [Micromonosporaceae bacterium]|nr:acyl-CoA dehydrogenase family protein [Micromonosporaceae bacterium]